MGSSENLRKFDSIVRAGGEDNTDSHSIDRSLYDDQEPAQPDLPVEVRSDEAARGSRL